MFQLWRSFGKFDGCCQFSTWMYWIALNVVMSAVLPVLVTVTTHHNDSGTVACTLVGYPRSASAVVGAPLGNRVVVEGFDGGVITVTGSP